MTHYWKNEDPLKGRKGKSDLVRRQRLGLYSGVRQHCWHDLQFRTSVQGRLYNNAFL